MVTHLQRVRVLYKTLLRLQKGLPKDLQELGTSYLKEEFKKHKSCNEIESQQFLMEWTKYAVQLSQQLRKPPNDGGKDLGSSLDEMYWNNMRDDQLMQLYYLMLTAKGEKVKDD